MEVSDYMGPSTLSISYSKFESICRKTFRFLEDDFGFRIHAVERGPINVGVSITYTNSTTGVEISYEPSERTVFVTLIKLIDGKLPDYPERYPANTVYIEELMPSRLSEDLNKVQAACCDSPRDLDHFLLKYSHYLRQFAASTVRGNFATFDRALKKRKKIPRAH